MRRLLSDELSRELFGAQVLFARVSREARVLLQLVALLATLAMASTAMAEPSAPADVGVTEHLGDQLPADAAFVDHEGRQVRLGDYFDGRRPFVLIFGYHTCPMLCGLVQEATAEALRGVGWVVGKDFDVVVVSIDPSDTPAIAAGKRALVVERYAGGAPGKGEGWHYLTGAEPAIRAATDAAGFHYRYDPETKQFAHPAVVLIATPQGKIARYLYGIELRASDVRYALLEAARGRSTTTLDRILLYCMRFDSRAGRYTILVGHVMQVGGAACAIGVGALLASLSILERRRRLRDASA